MIVQQQHIDFFNKIYQYNSWNGSGEGSYFQNTVGYRNFLAEFIKQNNIKTVVDYGCGDWQFSKFIDWSEVNYTGIDCVSSLIENHNIKYGAKNIKFLFLKDVELFLRDFTGDLLILKDVLQHWLNDEIIYFLDNVTKNFTYTLITNGCNQTHDWQNAVDQFPDRFRPLSCDFFPLKKYNIKKKAIITNGAGNKEISVIYTPNRV